MLVDDSRSILQNEAQLQAAKLTAGSIPYQQDACMNYEHEHMSSIERQWKTATYLAAKGSETQVVVPLVLNALQRIDQQVPILGHRETRLLSQGIVYLGHILAQAGLDLQKSLHRPTYDWMLQQANSPHELVAGSAVWALGWLQHPQAIDVLRAIALDDSREDNPAYPITVRGSAFRALMRIDRNAVQELIGSRACREYLAGVQNWLVDASSETAIAELRSESAWLRPDR